VVAIVSARVWEQLVSASVGPANNIIMKFLYICSLSRTISFTLESIKNNEKYKSTFVLVLTNTSAA